MQRLAQLSSTVRTVSVILIHTLLWVVLSFSMAACGASSQPGSSTPLSASNTPAPALSATTTASRANAVSTLTPTPKATERAKPTLKLTATKTPTAMPASIISPEAPADAFHLKSWDRTAALRILNEAGRVSIPEVYEDLRSFYQVSLLYEALLAYPDLGTDPGLNQQLAGFKGLTIYDAPYGLLHDHAVEPFRKMMEQGLNDGSVQLSTLNQWMNGLTGREGKITTIPSDRLFDRPFSAQVIKVSALGWDYFVIQTDASGHHSVFALYPEWKSFWQSEETFQITDLNANGRDEIAITYDHLGVGFSHFCDKSFKLYEWDGSTFSNLMADPLEVYTETGSNGGTCLDITFPDDPQGGKKIQAGSSYNTLCPEMPYLNLMTFSWNGKAYQKEPQRASPPLQTAQPNRCTIDWAIKAGPKNDAALSLLTAALADWPAEAEKNWGPAARDFLKLKLAAWNMQRGQIEAGLDLLRQVRDHPNTPAYPLPARIAATFLDHYKTEGLYRATQAVDALYSAETTKEWGFSSKANDFTTIGAFSLSLKQEPPATLNDLLTWLDRIGYPPGWSIQGDLDGQGDEDWFVVIGGQLYAFLRQSGQIKTVPLTETYLSNNSTAKTWRWESFLPETGGVPENIVQAGTKLYAFRLLQIKGEIQVEMDLNSWMINSREEKERVQVRDWKIQEGRLVVEYDGREVIYSWNQAAGKLVPTGYAPELQQQNIRDAEQALYYDRDPQRALTIINQLLNARIYEDYIWASGSLVTNPPRLRPYLQYLLGLAYERSGDQPNAVRAYWQLWHDYPASPFSLAARSKLER